MKIKIKRKFIAKFINSMTNKYAEIFKCIIFLSSVTKDTIYFKSFFYNYMYETPYYTKYFFFCYKKYNFHKKYFSYKNFHLSFVVSKVMIF